MGFGLVSSEPYGHLTGQDAGCTQSHDFVQWRVGRNRDVSDRFSNRKSKFPRAPDPLSRLPTAEEDPVRQRGSTEKWQGYVSKNVRLASRNWFPEPLWFHVFRAPGEYQLLPSEFITKMNDEGELKHWTIALLGSKDAAIVGPWLITSALECWSALIRQLRAVIRSVDCCSRGTRH